MVKLTNILIYNYGETYYNAKIRLMATLDLSPYMGNSASYDDVTGALTLTLPTGLIEETALLKILEDIESNAQGKRETDLNFPIGQKSFEDDPKLSVISRTDGTNTETQLEKIYQFVGFYKFDENIIATYSNAVNDND